MPRNFVGIAFEKFANPISAADVGIQQRAPARGKSYECSTFSFQHRPSLKPHMNGNFTIVEVFTNACVHSLKPFMVTFRLFFPAPLIPWPGLKSFNLVS